MEAGKTKLDQLIADLVDAMIQGLILMSVMLIVNKLSVLVCPTCDHHAWYVYGKLNELFD